MSTQDITQYNQYSDTSSDDDNWCIAPESKKASYYDIVCWNAGDKHGN